MALLLQERQYGTYCWLLRTVIILLTTSCIPSVAAYGDVFVMNSSLICDACESFCDTYFQVSHVLINDCQRGCRIFDTTLNNKASIFTHFDDAAALTSCLQSCSEAYGDEDAGETACSDGCRKAQEKYHKIYSLSLQWLHDVQNNMTFFETLLEVTGSIVFPSAIGIDAGKFIDEDISTRKQINKKRLPAKVDPPPAATPHSNYVPKNSNDGSVTSQSDYLPSWITQSAFVLITLGMIMIVGVCCYCCVVVRFYKQNRKEVVDSDLPPSYEHLMRRGFLIVPNGRNNSSDFKSNKHTRSSPTEDDELVTVDIISESEGRFSARQHVRQHSYSV